MVKDTNFFSPMKFHALLNDGKKFAIATKLGRFYKRNYSKSALIARNIRLGQHFFFVINDRNNLNL